jgi:hypothetical protein
MNLQNGYKVIYEKAADGKRTFYASKTGVFADAEVITEAVIGQYKLIYEKAGRFYGSETGIPAEGDYCFEAFDKVFKVAEDEVVETPDEPTNEDVPVETPKGEIETPTEEEGEF